MDNIRPIATYSQSETLYNSQPRVGIEKTDVKMRVTALPTTRSQNRNIRLNVPTIYAWTWLMSLIK